MNEINSTFDNAIQPDRLSLQLKDHQLKILNRTQWLESKSIKINESCKLLTECGVIGDRVGSGKSFVILGLIASNLYVKKTKLNAISTSSDMISVINYKDQSTVFDKPANIIVVPHNIFNQWEGYIKTYTDFNVKYICKRSSIEPFDYFDKDIILVSSSMYKDFIQVVSKFGYCFQRLIFDEADSIAISNCIKIKANFYWFISSSIDNLLHPNGKCSYKQMKHNVYNYYYIQRIKDIYGICKRGFIKKTFIELSNTTYGSYMFLKCSDELIEQSMDLIEPTNNIIYCKSTQILNVLSGLITQNIQQMISAGDITSAIKELCITETTETNLIKTVANNLYTDLNNKQIELDMKSQFTYPNEDIRKDTLIKIEEEIVKLETKINNIKERINTNNIDPITYDNIDNPVITTCCNQKFDFVSISSWIAKNPSVPCPICREVINMNNLVSIIDDNGVVEMKENSENIEYNSLNHDKDTNLEHILLNKLQSNAKILIFSEYDHSFTNIIQILNRYNLKHCQIKGGISHINNIINSYRGVDLDVLFLNARHYGAGLNLENTTDIIIYHKMNSELERQVIGRAQRIGRETQLNIWKLYYKT
jgi:hypothetical protein